MPFFYIKNAKSQDVYICEEPWKFDTSKFPFDYEPQRYKSWWKSPSTDGCLLSLNSVDYATGAYGTRVDKRDNPPRVIYGLSADYDNSLVDEAYLEKIKANLPLGCEYAPQWASISQSGKLHLFWLFEKPVNVINVKHAERFIRIAMDAVKAKLFGVTTNDYDTKASESITQYIDIGKKWIPMRPRIRIPAGATTAWSYKAAEATIASRLNGEMKSQELPFDIVNQLIRKHYPHADIGEVRLGTRCKRFWDPSADNPTGACAMADGFAVFTPHDNGFVSWAHLFGQAEVDDAVGNSKASIVDDFYYVPRKTSAIYYQRMYDERGETRFRTIEKDMLKVYLREAGFSTKARDGERVSELDKAMMVIREKNIVECAAPYLYFPSGRIYDKALDSNGYVLNISTIKAIKPDATEDAYSNGAFFENPQTYLRFPFIYRLLVSLFCESREEYDAWDMSKTTYNGSHNTQLNVFLSWLAHFYRNAYRNVPSCGQALYLVGPSGCGKTFLASHIIPALMGGRAAAGEQYFLYGGNFTREISSCPVIVLDDVIPSTEYTARVSATQKIKSFVASSTLKYEAKGQDAVTVPFRGRLICTSNNTERDMTVLPTIDSTTEDKFTILSVGKAGFNASERSFLTERSREDTMLTVLSELPQFARFLLEWKTPEDIYDARWGVQGYQDPSVVREAVVTSATVSTFMEVLSNMLLTDALPKDAKSGAMPDFDTKAGRAMFASTIRDMVNNGKLQPLKLTSLRLYSRMQRFDQSSMRPYSPGQVQYALTQMASNQSFSPFVYQTSSSAKRSWIIDYRFLFAYNGDTFEEVTYTPPSI